MPGGHCCPAEQAEQATPPEPPDISEAKLNSIDTNQLRFLEPPR